MTTVKKDIEDIILKKYEDLKQRYKEDLEAKIIVAYIGTINQNVIITATNAIERQLDMMGEPLKLIRGISYTAIELLQNILFHSEKNDDGFHLSYILIVEDHGKFHIHSSNLVDASSKDLVVNTIEKVSSLDKKKLNKIYAQKLREAELKENKAGLGLISLALKSEGNINFSTEEITDNYIILNISITF